MTRLNGIKFLLVFFLSFVLFTWLFNQEIMPISAAVNMPNFSSPSLTPFSTIQPISSANPILLPTVEPTSQLSPVSSPIINSPSPISLPVAYPIPLASMVSRSDIDNWLKEYADYYGVSEDLLRSIAACESKFNPSAQNGDYAGLYQFSSSAWQNTRMQMNLDKDPDLRYNPEQAIKTAAYKISVSGTSAWSNCSQ